MKILLFGGSGQLGYEIKTRAYDLNFELIAPVSSEVDVGNFEQVRFLTSQAQPDLIINCAAYTAVERAENERDRCFRINRDGAGNVAKAAELVKRPIIYISTDYVFAGDGNAPLKENDATGPLNVYGESKLAGEREVLSVVGDRALILRTSGLHGQRGVNFVNTMLTLFKGESPVRVVNDQVMSPTWAGWLAEVILDLSRKGVTGLLHASGEGGVSWYEFARAIYEWSGHERSAAAVEPVTTAEFGRPAKRPKFTAFDCSKLAGVLGRRPLTWQEGLKQHLREVAALKSEQPAHSREGL